MSKVRLLGPRERLSEVLNALQDFGLVHLAPATDVPGVAAVELSREERRERRHLRRIIEEIEAVLQELGVGAGLAGPGPGEVGSSQLASWARRARRVRRRLEELSERASSLHEERGLIEKYRGFFSAFRPLLERVARSPNLISFAVVVRGEEESEVSGLRANLEGAIGDEFTLESHELEGGDLALLLVLPTERAERVEELLMEARVPEVPIPASYGGRTLAEAVPRMLGRLSEIPGELKEIQAARRELRREHLPELLRARTTIHDRLRRLDARSLSGVTRHAFVVEGWLPADACGRLEIRLAEQFGTTVVVEEVSKEEWSAQEAPVVLSNPRLFRPFETVVRLMPLPTYGSIDPTPFVAVFFPMFFGLILGDVGYGLLLAVAGLVVHARSAPGGLVRAVSEIAGPCALFTIIFGFLYGEFFGDLGHRWLGLEPLLFNREEAILAFLALAVALGVVHVFLGLVLGAASALRGHPREALGRGAAAMMLVLIVVALMAAFEVLPGRLFTPAVIALLVLFPVLVVAEGLIAPVEFLSTLGSVLSYARIMALGTASVMLAVVANRMIGALGSALVGIVFALLFHLVNFAVGVFSPTIHALRLHYVEFFGKFYSPGGHRYEPFGHWSPKARNEN